MASRSSLKSKGELQKSERCGEIKQLKPSEKSQIRQVLEEVQASCRSDRSGAAAHFSGPQQTSANSWKQLEYTRLRDTDEARYEYFARQLSDI